MREMRANTLRLHIFLSIFLRFPLYNEKSMATRQIWSKLYETFFGSYLGIYTALGRWLERLMKFLENPDTLMCTCLSYKALA